MTSDSTPRDGAIGNIVAIRAGCIVVKLSTGEEVLCRSLKRLHRPLGFVDVPLGRRARIRYTKGSNALPRLIEVLKD